MHDGLDTIRSKGFVQRFQHRVMMLTAHHVDHINNDDPADVAQPHLPCDLLTGFQVGLQDSIGKCRFAVAALKAADPRWPAAATPAFYVHHLASAIGERGAGALCLSAIEDYARATGKTHVRLDSAVDNPTLTAYYEGRGYSPVGRCIDGAYEGILREKKV